MLIAEEQDLWRRLYEQTVSIWSHLESTPIVEEQDLALCLSVGPKNDQDSPRSQPASCPSFLTLSACDCKALRSLCDDIWTVSW